MRYGSVLPVAAAALAVAIALPAAAAAEVTYYNGKVITVDSSFRTAEAFTVKDGRFTAVGSSAQLLAAAGPSTRLVDLEGRTVVPGFIDAHPHSQSRANRLARDTAADLSLKGANSVAEITARIRKAASQAAAGEWIVTGPIGEAPDYFWLPDSLAEKRWPTRADLDAAAPRNPVYIPSPTTWPHPAVLNTAALEAAGLHDADEAKLRAEGISLVRDRRSDEPNGHVFGTHIYNRRSALLRQLRAYGRPVPAEAEQEALREVFRQNLAAGVTTIFESHGITEPAAYLSQLRGLRAAGHPVSRVIATFEAPRGRRAPEIADWIKGVRQATVEIGGDDFTAADGVTVSLDGATQFGAAAMTHPYLNPNGELSNGTVPFSEDELAAIATAARAQGLRFNVVLAGDLAGEICTRAFEAVHAKSPIDGQSWVVHHFQHPTQDQIRRLRDMGVMAAMYSAVDYSKGAETYVKRFPGQDVWKHVVPLRWWLDGGIVVAQGTDGAHFEPMFTLWQSLVRTDGRTGRSLMSPAKQISREEAIRLYTINGATVVGWEDRIGSIEAGKFADFVVLDRDVLTIPVDEIRDTRVVMTSLNGQIVHSSVATHANGPAAQAGR